MFQQHIDACFSDKVGKPGISQEAFLRLREQTRPILHSLQLRKLDNSLPILNLPEITKDLEIIEKTAQQLQANFKNLVVLGTGGSSLNGQAWLGLRSCENRVGHVPTRVHFMDNIDPYDVECLLAHIPLKQTAFLAISKSGKTLETLTQMLVCMDIARKECGHAIGKQFFVISDPVENPLRHLGASIGATLLDHDPGVGGRFSTFTNVGLLPAAAAGIDIRKARQGAAKVLEETFSQLTLSEVAAGAALQVAFMQHGMNATVMMAYVDRLANFVTWYRQIWAESLGKEGKGTTPVKAMGTLDQHSQLQLYLDGPRDKFFTFVTMDTTGHGYSLDIESLPDIGLGYVRGKNLGDVLQAEHQATIGTMVRKQCPLREFRIARLNEEILGALLMHFTLETIVVAGLLSINAFDQPAVEAGKVLARQLLEQA